MAESKNKKKSVIGIAAVIIVVILAALLGFTNYRGGYQIYDRTAHMVTNERTADSVLIDWLTNDKNFDIENYKETYQIEEIELNSSLDGHKIPASYIYAPGNTDKSGDTVIMVHGLFGNRLSNYPMAQLFLSQGMNVITYDQRSSGGNSADTISYGYLESFDTMDYIHYATEQMDSDSVLGVWGQSMGAATVENAMDDDFFDQNVDFVVLDCPLGNMEKTIAGSSFTDKIQIGIADVITQNKMGYSYKEQRIFDQITKYSIPTLVVCSKADERIPYEVQIEIYEAIPSEQKMLFSVDDSKHSDIYFDYPEEYQAQVVTFLENL